jgi:hypothetical protein
MDATSDRRWLRFGPRSVLLLLTVAAVVSWIWWDGAARWRWHREQTQFETAVKRLKVGGTFDQAMVDVDLSAPSLGYIDDGAGNQIAVSYRWPNAIYVMNRRHAGSNVVSVEVFRLPPAPPDYEATTTRGRETVSKMAPDDGEKAVVACQVDFFEFLYGDRARPPTIDYELIHSAARASALE